MLHAPWPGQTKHTCCPTDAMRSLGDELSARTVQIIFESMVNTRAAHLLLQALKITGGTPEQL